MNIEIGDRIKFKAATRWNCSPVWRKVTGFWMSGPLPTVRYGGWPDFAVRLDEIIEIEKGATKSRISDRK